MSKLPAMCFYCVLWTYCVLCCVFICMLLIYATLYIVYIRLRNEIWFHYNLHSFYYCSGKEEMHWNIHRRKLMKSGLSGQIMLWSFQITRSYWLGTHFVSNPWNMKMLVFVFGIWLINVLYMCCILCCSLICWSILLLHGFSDDRLNLLLLYFGVYAMWIMNLVNMDQCLIMNMNLFWL